MLSIEKDVFRMKYKKTIITIITVLVVIVLGVTAKQLFYSSTTSQTTKTASSFSSDDSTSISSSSNKSTKSSESTSSSASSSSSKSTKPSESTNSSASSSSSKMSSSSSSSMKVKKIHNKRKTNKKINKAKLPLTARGNFKPITPDFYGNWYYGNQPKIVVQDYLFRGDHPTDPVSGPGPLVMQRYGNTNAVYIRSLYAMNTYWPATLKVNDQQSYSVMVTSNAKKFNDFKIYTSVPTAQPIKEFVYANSHPELVDNHNLSMDQLNSLK